MQIYEDLWVKGNKYSRADLKELAGLNRNTNGGPWDTGIVEWKSQFLIFANVGESGRTGHQYNNKWEGLFFRWFHKSGSCLSWPSVQRMLHTDSAVHLFWRSSNRSLFEYSGRVFAVNVESTSPVEVLWAVPDAPIDSSQFAIESEVPSGVYKEGAVRQVTVNVYERSRAARRACIDYFGTDCCVCGFNFERRYGLIGKGFIHIHHIRQFADVNGEYQLDPIRDLRPVCPNCHAILHQRCPPHSLEEIRALLKKRHGDSVDV